MVRGVCKHQTMLIRQPPFPPSAGHVLTCACLPIHSPIPSQRPHPSSLPPPLRQGVKLCRHAGTQCSSRRVFFFFCSCSGFDSASSMRTELEISVPSRPRILVRPVNKQQACDRACVRIRTVVYPQHVLDNSLACGISAGQTSWGHDGSLGPRERKKNLEMVMRCCKVHGRRR